MGGSALKTVGLRRLRAETGRVHRVQLDLFDQARAEVEALRPRTRADCERVPRPCPFVSCRFNLYLDVKPNGSIVLNHPGREVWEMERSCALDAAEEGGLTLAEVGQALNVTRERVRQLQVGARRRLRGLSPLEDWNG